MNANGKKMVELLKELRDDYGCVAVKAEFEAEGSRTDEMIMLDEVLNTVNMPLTIKIGGCEAVRVAVPDDRAADVLRELHDKSPVPLIADIHFDYYKQ